MHSARMIVMAALRWGLWDWNPNTFAQRPGLTAAAVAVFIGELEIVREISMHPNFEFFNHRALTFDALRMIYDGHSSSSSSLVGPLSLMACNDGSSGGGDRGMACNDGRSGGGDRGASAVSADDLPGTSRVGTLNEGCEYMCCSSILAWGILRARRPRASELLGPLCHLIVSRERDKGRDLVAVGALLRR